MNTESEPFTASYVRQTAQFIGLPLAPEHEPGVVENLRQLHAIAQPLLEFPVPEAIEVAPVFLPAPAP